MDNTPDSSTPASSTPKRPRWELTALAFAAYLGGKHLHWSEGMLGFFRIFVVITAYQLIEYQLGLSVTQTKYPGRYLVRMIPLLVSAILIWQGIEARSAVLAGVGFILSIAYFGIVRSQQRFFISQQAQK